MPKFRTQRVRDPVHGLIVFSEEEVLDELAWDLLNVPEFQRLRRIKQLGVSEFVYPGATHTRFAHSVGVFHTARIISRLVKRELDRELRAEAERGDQEKKAEEFDDKRANVAIIAALLHDLGHGPFSHTFEEVRKSQGVKKRHEQWTAEIIRNPNGAIWSLLEAHRGGFGEAVAKLLETEDPQDIYHAIVSSSFDADRLDYLQRDRKMTGTGVGAIDFDWLTEHVRVKSVRLDAPDGDSDAQEPTVATFCLDFKALAAAEQFLLARYTLHEGVYFHKTTRCVEHMIAALLREVASCTKPIASVARLTGLEKSHPLIKFFCADGATVENFLSLDDVVVMAAFERMRFAENQKIASLARRLLNRDLFKTLDIRWFGSDPGTHVSRVRRIDKMIAEGKFTGLVMKDVGAGLSIYSYIGGDEEKAHKKLRVLDGAGHPKEIIHPDMSKIIAELAERRQLTRYYFENESDRELVRQLGREH